MNKENSAYVQGATAYEDFKAPDANPYAKGTKEYKAWLTGYDDAWTGGVGKSVSKMIFG